MLVIQFCRCGRVALPAYVMRGDPARSRGNSNSFCCFDTTTFGIAIVLSFESNLKETEDAMETLAVIGLIGNIVQFVDFSGKLISKSIQLYQSSDGVLTENINTETATNHLIRLNNKLENAANATGDKALHSLCKSCGVVAVELLRTLDKLKVEGEKKKWKSTRKALRSLWSKEKIQGIEKQLTSFREELNLHIVVDLRCVSRLT
jgi:hypothetical protein